MFPLRTTSSLGRVLTQTSKLTRPSWAQRYIHQPRSFSTSQTLKDVQYVRFGGSSGGPGPVGKGPQKRPGYSQHDLRFKVLGGIGLLGGAYYLAHLEQVPETGRWRFMNTSPKFEAELGEMLRAQSKEEFRGRVLPASHPVARHVRRVASHIINTANLGHIVGDPQPFLSPALSPDVWNPDTEIAVQRRGEKEWDVIVVNDTKMVNAQALPGLIVVYTGILPICQDEQGLAAVLSHEIGHVVARHTAERISSQSVFILMIAALQLLGLDWGFSNLIHSLFLELPNSRTQEREADVIGLRLMANACYDPRAAPEMFERLAQVESKLQGRAGFEFMRTHPTSKNRVKYLEEMLPQAYAILAANPECSNIQGFKDAASVTMIPVTREMMEESFM